MEIKREALSTEPKYRRLAAQRAASPETSARVDRAGGMNAQGMIAAASLCTEGEALGHGLWLDSDFIQSVADGVNQFNKGVKSRFTHPGLSSDGIAKHLGRATNSSVAGDQALGDIHFTKSSHNTPEGDLSGYVMDLADESPEDVAISIVYEPDEEAELEFMLANGAKVVDGYWVDRSGFKSPDPDNVDNLPHARLSVMIAADFVGDPAANPGGLFSREQKFASEAEALATFALGLSDKRPEAVALGLDAERVQQFVNRFLTQHNLEIVPMRKQNDTAPAADTKPTETPAAATPTAEAKPAEQSAEAGEQQSQSASDPPAPKLSADRAEAKRFQDAFGADGGKWYSDGLSFEAAQVEFTKKLGKANEELQKQNAELSKKLAAGGVRGEERPIEYDGGADKPKRNGFASKIRIGAAPAQK